MDIQCRYRSERKCQGESIFSRSDSKQEASMKFLAPLILIVAICLGCGGGGQPSAKGPPIMFNLTSTPIGGNADPRPLNADTLTGVELFKEYEAPLRVLVRANFAGAAPGQIRRLAVTLPGEANLVVGTSFDFPEPDQATISLDDNWQVSFPNNSWGAFNGTGTVESRQGRVITVRLDAIGEPRNEATGQIRIQGTIILDFSQQIEPPAD